MFSSTILIVSMYPIMNFISDTKVHGLVAVIIGCDVFIEITSASVSSWFFQLFFTQQNNFIVLTQVLDSLHASKTQYMLLNVTNEERAYLENHILSERYFWPQSIVKNVKSSQNLSTGISNPCLHLCFHYCSVILILL